MSMKDIVGPLMWWYKENKRDLPWRQDREPYHVWISEIMLQQTRVEAVKGYYRRFLEKLPDISSLAVVEDDVLMKLWQGLGYYNRARNLKRTAEILVEQYGGAFPEDFESILALPGIGAYTAGAIASIAFGIRVPAADGNVYRIYTRLQAEGGDISKGTLQKKIREEIAQLVPEEEPGEFNQALMDLGAGICLPNGEPLCEECPVRKFCQARADGNPTDYPYKSPKKARRLEEKTVFVLEYQGNYFLRQRPEEGLLAGLWEFPTEEGSLTIQEVCGLFEAWGGKIDEMELLGKAKHIFSHIEWRMLGYLIHLQEITPRMREEFTFATREELRTRYSIPTAYAVYLKPLIE